MAIIDRPIELEEPKVMDEANQLLLEAQRYIKRHGWVPQPYGPNQERCMVMALLCGSDRVVGRIALQRLAQAIGLPQQVIHTTRAMIIGQWNDRYCQSEEEAIAMLRKAMEYK